MHIAQQLHEEAGRELRQILDWWQASVTDVLRDGFVPKVGSNGEADTTAPLGIVLMSRILWTFSAAYRLTQKKEDLETAAKCYHYIRQHFFDAGYGGVFWSIHPDGTPKDDKKQIYALSFAIYGLSEYHLATGDKAALKAAIDLFNCIEDYSRDKMRGGYIEALTRSWQPIADLRLSEKDANECKTMNTHLHVLEAYTNLYRINPDQQIRDAIAALLAVFKDHLIDPQTHHFNLFFDDDWVQKGNLISFGHDIEGAWLLLEAAESIKNAQWTDWARNNSVQMADAAARGLDADGGLWHEMDAETGHWQYEKHWWPQAEALVGFFNAWQLSANRAYLEKAWLVWQFIDQYIKDKQLGEWKWGIDRLCKPMQQEDKAGFWKCPYHNGRACMEIIKRTSAALY